MTGVREGVSVVKSTTQRERETLMGRPDRFHSGKVSDRYGTNIHWKSQASSTRWRWQTRRISNRQRLFPAACLAYSVVSYLSIPVCPCTCTSASVCLWSETVIIKSVHSLPQQPLKVDDALDHRCGPLVRSATSTSACERISQKNMLFRGQQHTYTHA